MVQFWHILPLLCALVAATQLEWSIDAIGSPAAYEDAAPNLATGSEKADIPSTVPSTSSTTTSPTSSTTVTSTGSTSTGETTEPLPSPSEYPPYWPRPIDVANQLLYCNFGGMRIYPSNAIQLQQHGAALFAGKNKCTFDDWVGCSLRTEDTCAGELESGVTCRWKPNDASAVETFGPGSCIFSCYPDYAASQGIPIFQNSLREYDGIYADMKNTPDTIDQFTCFNMSSKGEEACAATKDSTGHACVPCKVPTVWYGMDGSASSGTEGLDFWCVNNRGFERYCDFLREPAFLCSNIKEAEYPVDYDGPTIVPVTSTSTTTSTTTAAPTQSGDSTSSGSTSSGATSATTEEPTGTGTNPDGASATRVLAALLTALLAAALF